MTARTAKVPVKRKTKIPVTRTAKVPVNERTLRAAAKRLLGNGQIVWNEIFYIQRTMASRATQIEIDESVIAVRKLSWTDITVAE